MKKLKLKELLAKREAYSLVSENIEITFYVLVCLIISILVLTGFIVYDKFYN